MENTAGNAVTMPQRCHPERQNASRYHVHPVNRSEVLIWQNFQPAYRDLGNRDSRSTAGPPSHTHIENFTKDRGKARSRKPGSCEEALSRVM